MEKLMIVDDCDVIRGQLKWGLGKEYEILSAANRKAAITLFRKHLPKVVALDLGLPPDSDGAEEGLRCLEEILGISPATKVVVITGNDDRENALRAIQGGAYDYYSKPVEINELRTILRRAYHLSAIERENIRIQSTIDKQRSGLSGIIGHCPQMLGVFSVIRKVASSDVPVFITGESGTGKELVARAIHDLSLRKAGAFIPINCGAIPENLLESELFGYEKGAFSGAHNRVQGKVEFSHKGTLFLDEIGELPLNLQVKLLRFLQEKTVQRVGGREDIVVDARIVAATNRDIEKDTKEGSFREDLYYRIGVIHISLPPLRERGDDIMVLANLFLRRYSEEFRKKIRGFSAASVKLLQSYEWPGNVRELENKVQRAVIMSDSPLLEPDVLGFLRHTSEESVSLGEAWVTLKDARERTEREVVMLAIGKQCGNMAKAAEMLGVSRPTLYDLVRKHSLVQIFN